MVYLWRAIIDFFRDERYRVLILSAFSFLFTGTLVFHFVEGWRILDSLYYSVITLTTVGYGDFSPHTDFGKVFSILYVITGIGIIFGFINAFTKQRNETAERYHERARERRTRIRKKVQCRDASDSSNSTES